MKYQNPVIPGFYPDPSICRVGEDFYLVNSTFEYFPGVPVFHSKDLVHWEQIGHCITRNSQLTLYTGHQNYTGIYAPTICYHEGTFYMATTNASGGQTGTGNFYVWTKDPAGEWSDPVFLDAPGIDPSFFFDDDGKAYFTGTADCEIFLYEMDFAKQKLVGDRVKLWEGSGGAYAEGPHLYKKNGWYYLLISEGGTERCHMLTMARSKNVTGPYEPCPHNPVLTNRSLGWPIESAGHGDLIEDQNGNWWAVCLGTRNFSYPPKHNLGRETMLMPVDFSGEWPVFGDKGRLREFFETDLLPGTGAGACGCGDAASEPGACDCSDSAPEPGAVYRDDFEAAKLDLGWNFIYNPDWSLYGWGDGKLRLFGNEKGLQDPDTIAWIGRRQKHHVCSAQVTLEFPCCQEEEEAGLTIYMNHRHHYEIGLRFEGQERKLIFRRQIGSLFKVEQEIPYQADSVSLKLEADLDFYRFFRQKEDGSWEEFGKGETRYLTTEVGGNFTGNYIGLYSTGGGKKCKTAAAFSGFCYEGK